MIHADQSSISTFLHPPQALLILYSHSTQPSRPSLPKQTPHQNRTPISHREPKQNTSPTTTTSSQILTPLTSQRRTPIHTLTLHISNHFQRKNLHHHSHYPSLPHLSPTCSNQPNNQPILTHYSLPPSLTLLSGEHSKSKTSLQTKEPPHAPINPSTSPRS
ncbi:hypothetical protein M758_3G092400 [Ceratodon purpureus]|nr:hypothetical protein M758_3G092400 [Ceratodon purpureus]